MKLGWFAIGLILMGLGMMPVPKLYRLGMALFVAGLLLGGLSAADL